MACNDECKTPARQERNKVPFEKASCDDTEKFVELTMLQLTTNAAKGVCVLNLLHGECSKVNLRPFYVQPHRPSIVENTVL